MAEKAHPNEGGVRVNSVDRLGRRIDPAVLNAAEEIGRRALRHAERQLIDPAVAATLLEEAAATVSRAMSAAAMSERPIRDLRSYLFRAFLRRVNKRLKRELSLAESLRTHAREASNNLIRTGLYCSGLANCLSTCLARRSLANAANLTRSDRISRSKGCCQQVFCRGTRL